MHNRFLDALPRSIPDAFASSFPAERQAGLVALGNVLRTVGALLLMCDPRDLGVFIGEEISRGQHCFEPNLYLYENYSGHRPKPALYRLVEQLLERAEPV
jgi:DEAD/DEAH box helicase domain-containing protein